MQCPVQRCSQYPNEPESDRGNGSTADCANAFKTYVSSFGRPVNAAETRALLPYCQDVNPCNSGLGLGFNPAYPSGGGTLAEHLTGREYVLINESLKELGAAPIGLPPREVTYSRFA